MTISKLLLAVSFLLLVHEGIGQTHRGVTKKPTSNPVSPQVSPTEAAHVAVMKFMAGLKIADLPEGREAVESTQWITGAADRGENFYSRPKYTSADSLYTKLFETDIDGVSGYKEFFSLQGINNAGASKSFKYLVVSFEDQRTGEWKILFAADDDGSFDFVRNARFFSGLLQDTSLTSARSNYLTYAKWSFLAGHLKDAAAALATAKTLPPDADPIIDLQVEALSNVLNAVTQK